MRLPQLVDRSEVLENSKKTTDYDLKTQNCKSRGFTLIELLVVMTIIAVILGGISVSWRNAQLKGRDGQRKSDLKSVQLALEQYLQVNAKYPTSKTNLAGWIYCNVTGDTNVRTWGNKFICGIVTYMQVLPKDPIKSGVILNYYYCSSDSSYCNFTPTTNPTTYTLWATLENLSDPEINNCPAMATIPGFNYCVRNP